MGDRLAAAGVLAEQDGLTFVHPAIQVAVRSSLPSGVLAEAHLRAARVLADEDAHPEEIAQHLLHASRGGGDWVTAVLRRTASRALAQGDAPRAVELLERAPAGARRRGGPRPGSPGAGAGRGHHRLSRCRRPDQRCDRATPGADERARAALDAGRTLMALGRLEDAAAAFELGVAHAARGSDLGGLLGAGRSTVLRMLAGRAVVRRAARAPADGRTATDRALLASWPRRRAPGRAPRAVRSSWPAAPWPAGALLDDDTAEGIAYYLAAAALTVAEDLQMAEAALAAAVNDARSRGSALALATASHFQSLRDHAPRSRARRGGRGTRGSRGRAPRLAAGPAVRARGAGRGSGRVRRPGRGGGTGRASRRDAEARTSLSRSRPLARAGRSCISARGRPQEALADFIACGELLGAAGAPNPAVLPWRSGAARALAALGDRSEARRLAGEELALAETFGAPGAIGRALRTLGSLEEGKQAIDLLEAAVAYLESSQTALERARALIDLGSTLRRTHRSRDARDPLRRGLDLAQRCGAGELAKRAMREVTAAGARPRRTALHGFEALTPRELQTAGLAAEGKSNREIAAALFVTVKTVEWHLKHSYGKLGISSRQELAAAAALRQPGLSAAAATFELTPGRARLAGDCGMARKLLKAWSVAVDIHPGVTGFACTMQ